MALKTAFVFGIAVLLAASFISGCKGASDTPTPPAPTKLPPGEGPTGGKGGAMRGMPGVKMQGRAQTQ
jgi:hypothetical protein